MLAFCVYINAFPVISSAGDFKSLFLPALTLAIAMSSKYTRQVRSAVLEELHQDYVTGARMRGIKERVIFMETCSSKCNASVGNSAWTFPGKSSWRYCSR